MSEENVAVVKAILEGGDFDNKDAMKAALAQGVPLIFTEDAEWIEAPERVDGKTYRGHAGIIESFERWLDDWSEYTFDPQGYEDHGDQVFVEAQEQGTGKGSGATTEATIYSVLTFRDSKISRYEEFYDEATARAALAHPA